MKEQLSLLDRHLPAGTAPVWDALDAEQRALVVSTLARLMAKAALAQREPQGTADKEKGDD